MSRMGEARLCVLCHTQPVDPRWRPFCSERCRNVDLARWVDGTYRVAAANDPSEPTDAIDDADSD